MAKFRFSLDPLLELRRREEASCKREIALLESQRRHLEDSIRARQREISEGKDSMRTSLVGELDATLLRQQAAATMGVDRLARRAVLELAGQAQRIARVRATLVEFAQRRRALEMLRERRLAEWHANENRREVTFLDELATTAAAHDPTRAVLFREVLES